MSKRKPYHEIIPAKKTVTVNGWMVMDNDGKPIALILSRKTWLGTNAVSRPRTVTYEVKKEAKK